MKKILAAIIASVLLMGVFASCSGGETSKTVENTSAPSVTEPEVTTESDTRIYPDLPSDMTFDGESFHMLGRYSDKYASFCNFELYAESENGEVVNDAVYKRNITLEEKYKVKFEQTLDSSTEVPLKNAVLAGDDIYDMAILVHQTAAGIVTSGLTYDMYSLPYIDWDKPWWNKALSKGLEIYGKLYFTSSDLLLLDKNRTYCLLFNMDMINEFKLDNPYDLVYSGEWTLDNMRKMAEVVSDDIDGDGVMGSNDRWGLGLSSRANTYGFLIGTDNPSITIGNDGSIALTMYSDRLLSTVDKLIALTANKEFAFACEDMKGKVDYDYWSAAGNIFYAGNSLFNSSIISAVKSASSKTEINYGVLPMPKYDSAQEGYRTSSDREQSVVFSVPATIGNSEMVGFMLEALSAESHYTTRPAFIETACKVKYTYDEDSANMLDLVFDNTYYDLGYFFNWGNFISSIRDIITTGNNTLSSKYAAIEKKAVSAMEKTIEYFAEQ